MTDGKPNSRKVLWVSRVMLSVSLITVAAGMGWIISQPSPNKTDSGTELWEMPRPTKVESSYEQLVEEGRVIPEDACIRYDRRNGNIDELTVTSDCYPGGEDYPLNVEVDADGVHVGPGSWKRTTFKGSDYFILEEKTRDGWTTYCQSKEVEVERINKDLIDFLGSKMEQARY